MAKKQRKPFDQDLMNKDLGILNYSKYLKMKVISKLKKINGRRLSLHKELYQIINSNSNHNNNSSSNNLILHLTLTVLDEVLLIHLHRENLRKSQV